MTRVSICIPVYNGAPYLAAALASACAQSHTELEILVVDDVSTDDSLEIAQAVAAQDPRVRVTRNPANLGLVGNWNRCVELATGQWVKFLFQDDLLEPDCVQALLQHADKGWQFVACDRSFIFEDNAVGLDRAFFERNRAAVRAFLGPAGGVDAAGYAARALEQGLHRNLVGEPTVTLIARDLLMRTGPFSAALAQLCDAEYWLRLACQVGVGFVDRPLAHFRVHGISTTARNQQGAGFALDKLDRLALAQTAAMADVCAPLRSAAHAAGMDLHGEFRQRAHRVRQWADEHAGEPCGKGTVGAAYAAFLRAAPRCAVGQLPHAVWRMRTALWHLRHGQTN